MTLQELIDRIHALTNESNRIYRQISAVELELMQITAELEIIAEQEKAPVALSFPLVGVSQT